MRRRWHHEFRPFKFRVCVRTQLEGAAFTAMLRVDSDGWGAPVPVNTVTAGAPESEPPSQPE